MRWLMAALVVLLFVLQYRLWFAEGSLAERHRLQQQIEEQVQINDALQQRNTALEREVLDLQSGNKGLEQRAREELGLIGEGETFYQFVDLPDRESVVAGSGAVIPGDEATESGETAVSDTDGAQDKAP